MFNLVFLLAAFSLVWGLRLQSNPESAKKGNFLASMGMGLAIFATLFFEIKDQSIFNNLIWKLNATLSQNKIAEFNEFVDNWDTWEKDTVSHSNTDIAFSPSVIGWSQLVFTAFSSDKNGTLDLAFVSKYVGQQYIDNTSSEFAKLDAYLVHDFRLSYSLKTKVFKEVILSSWVRNLFNQNYISNAWVYRFNSSSNPDELSYDPYINTENNGYNMIGYFPQSTRNYLLGINLYL